MTSSDETSLSSFREYVYRIENIVDELAIIALSVGAIVVIVWSLFFASRDYTLLEFGRNIFYWITMVALMIIARELWQINHRLRIYLERQGE